MSYDISLKKNGETVFFEQPHHEQGGTYAFGGTNEAWLNVTYNYAPHFYRIFGKDGIRSLYGKTASESLPLLADAISKLKDDFTSDYWEPTEGNAKKSLQSLYRLAELAPPDSTWTGD